MRRTARPVVLSLALAMPLVPTPATSATDTVVQLPLTTFRDVEVDAVNGHVFVTGGPGSDGVVVRDLAGAAVTTLSALDDAMYVALSPDGSVVYVSVRDAIVALDPVTLTETARYIIGDSACPLQMAPVGQHIWFTYGCWDNGVGVVDLAAEPPTVEKGPLVARENEYDPELVSPRPGVLIVYPDAYEISGTTLRPYFAPKGSIPDREIAVIDNGWHVLTVGPEEEILRFDANLLDAPESAFGSAHVGTGTPVAIAAASPPNAGRHIVARGIARSGTAEVDVELWDAQAEALLRVHEGGALPDVLPGGLAIPPDASVLFVVHGDPGQPILLRVILDPARQLSTLTLSAPPGATIGAAHTLRGQLTAAYAPKGGTPLTVTRTSRYGTEYVHGATVANDGSFSVVDRVDRRGTYRYRVSYAGDDDRLPAEATTTLYVTGLTPSLTIGADRARYSYRATALVAARLGPTSSDRTVRITRRYWGESTAATVTSGTVDAEGYRRGSATVLSRTVFSATFPGDDVYEPRTVTRTVTVSAKLTQGVSGHYATSGSYHLYRSTVRPATRVTVTPHRPGKCVSYTAQRYSAGAWRTVANVPCIRLSTAGTATVPFANRRGEGLRYRVRTTWVGDVYHAPATGAWIYLRFTS